MRHEKLSLQLRHQAMIVDRVSIITQRSGGLSQVSRYKEDVLPPSSLEKC